MQERTDHPAISFLCTLQTCRRLRPATSPPIAHNPSPNSRSPLLHRLQARPCSSPPQPSPQFWEPRRHRNFRHRDQHHTRRDAPNSISLRPYATTTRNYPYTARVIIDTHAAEAEGRAWAVAGREETERGRQSGGVESAEFRRIIGEAAEEEERCAA